MDQDEQSRKGVAVMKAEIFTLIPRTEPGGAGADVARKAAVLSLVLFLVACATTSGSSPTGKSAAAGPPSAGDPAPGAKASTPPLPLLLLTEEEVLLDGAKIGDEEDLEDLRDAMRGADPAALLEPLARRARADGRARGGEPRLMLCLTAGVSTEMLWGALYTAMQQGFSQVTLAVQRPSPGKGCEELELAADEGEEQKRQLALVLLLDEETEVIIGDKRVQGPAEGRPAWIKQQLASFPPQGRIHVTGEELSFFEVVEVVRHLRAQGFSRLHLSDGQGMTFPHHGPEAEGLEGLNGRGGGSLATVFGGGLDGLGDGDSGDPAAVGLGSLASIKSLVGSVRLGQPRVDGWIAAELVAERTERLHDQLVSCYRLRLKRNPKLAGQLRLEFRIDAGGKAAMVRVAKDTVGDSSLAVCVKAAFARASFPRPGDRKPVRVKQPLFFGPP